MDEQYPRRGADLERLAKATEVSKTTEAKALIPDYIYRVDPMEVDGSASS